MPAALPTWFHDPVSTKRLFELLPQILGTGDKIAVPLDCRVNYFRLVNPTAADITVYITDRQSTPVYLLAPELLGASGGEIEFEIPGAGWPAIGGCIINTSASGVHAFLRSEIVGNDNGYS